MRVQGSGYRFKELYQRLIDYQGIGFYPKLSGFSGWVVPEAVGPFVGHQVVVPVELPLLSGSGC